MTYVVLAIAVLASALLLPAPSSASRMRGAQGETGSNVKTESRATAQRPYGARQPQRGFLSRTWVRVRAGPAGGAKAADPLSTAADIGLFAACLRAGLSTQQAASAVSEVADPEKTPWKEVASLLRVGATDEQAWAATSGVPGLDELARLVTLSGRSGAAVARGCDAITETLRGDAESSATAAAERAGVFISLPLALCFLPAFIVLGLVPVIVSLGTQLL